MTSPDLIGRIEMRLEKVRQREEGLVSRLERQGDQLSNTMQGLVDMAGQRTRLNAALKELVPAEGDRAESTNGSTKTKRKTRSDKGVPRPHKRKVPVA